MNAGHQHHRLQTRQCITRAVSMNGADRAVMSGVHRLHHVQSFAASDLTDDDSVRPHAQRVAHQISLRHRTLSLDVGGPSSPGAPRVLLQLCSAIFNQLRYARFPGCSWTDN